MHGMIDDKQIEVAITIIIEKNGLRVEAFHIQPKFPRPFGKTAIAIIDEQLIFTYKVFILSHFANIYVLPAIAVYVHDGHARFPIAFSRYAGLLRYIFKGKVAFVEV